MICPKCGAENRESAKFCLKCAQQMVPLRAAVDTAPAAPGRRLRKRRRPPADGRAQAMHAPTAPPRPGLYVFAGLLIASVTAWALFSITGQTPRGGEPLGTNVANARPTETSLASASSAPTPTVASMAAVAASSAQVSTTAPSASAPATAGRAARSEPAAPARTGAPNPRARAPKRAGSAIPASQPLADATPPPSPPPAPASRPATPPATAASLCSEAGFFAHAICLQRECGRADLRSHPQCVRMREQQKALREGSGDR